MEPINVGIIGCGYWGPNLIRNLVELPDSQVVAVSDLQRRSFEAYPRRLIPRSPSPRIIQTCLP